MTVLQTQTDTTTARRQQTAQLCSFYGTSGECTEGTRLPPRQTRPSPTCSPHPCTCHCTLLLVCTAVPSRASFVLTTSLLLLLTLLQRLPCSPVSCPRRGEGAGGGGGGALLFLLLLLLLNIIILLPFLLLFFFGLDYLVIWDCKLMRDCGSR